MNALIYSIFTYAATAVISYAVVGVIVLVNHIMSKANGAERKA